MVQGDRKFTSNLGVHGGVEILGNGFNVGLNKDVIWETAKTMGYTKIKSKCYTPFYPVADSDAVYVTIFCEEMERELCRFHPVEKKCNVIFSTEGYLCFSQENKIWQYDDNRKPELKQKEDVLREENVKLRKELETYQNKETQSTDYARLNKSKSMDDNKQLPSPQSAKKRPAEDNLTEVYRKLEKYDV